ncbi:sprouty-related, EVH1 domain-containing protein 2 isoform X2 [Sitodiplosis mosellana]|uniref:sprouty-related, EVH1 domain-containing protein 2 isoform X2 n=1 Tax=Sitodiplosis mosellana TaxID=263140 RepID=UPI0024451416|nr:sprouty-related, EVH1 domain-containing protein 2 isoform X2 [Sitodiplosis mosellana]
MTHGCHPTVNRYPIETLTLTYFSYVFSLGIKHVQEYTCDFLVKVRAQVMTRDESTEGWLPLAGGGLANVSIRKRARLPPEIGEHEYIIYGQRISDQTIILSCVINRDLQYNKVMPTFHHWRAGKQRNGLTFQTAADARAFDKGIIRAYDELIDGLNMVNSSQWPKMNTYNTQNTQIDDDDVFMTLDLPLEPSESRSSSEGNGSQASGCGGSEPSVGGAGNLWNKSQRQPQNAPPASGENYSYVQLTAVHEPVKALHEHRPETVQTDFDSEPINLIRADAKRESCASIKKQYPTDATTQSHKELVHTKRVRCRYCQEFFTEEFNRKGACEFAPDTFKASLEYTTAMKCARCMLYHCMSDSEGEMPQHPCECVPEESVCSKRWIGLFLLSMIFPCLCFYPACHLCHKMGISCGICGGRHRPQM